MRSKPAHSAELVSQAIMGTPVKVLKSEDDWFLIQTPDHYIGWTNPTSVQLVNTTELNKWKESNRIIYTQSCGTIYAERSFNEVLSDLVAGAIVTEKSRDKTTSEVQLPDGRVGFLNNANWLYFKQMKDTTTLIGDRLISTGKQFMGFPYLWGGFSSKGMDCSGFVKTVYFLNGEILQRDASQQYHYGDTIDVSTGYENLKKGDLLFFGSKEPLKITHVGMYIGESEFIHSSGFIHINSLEKERNNFSPALLSALVGARRIIGNTSHHGFTPIKQHQWY